MQFNDVNIDTCFISIQMCARLQQANVLQKLINESATNPLCVSTVEECNKTILKHLHTLLENIVLYSRLVQFWSGLNPRPASLRTNQNRLLLTLKYNIRTETT